MTTFDWKFFRMRLPFKIAIKYLFGRVSSILLISVISILGVSLGAAALILVLSVFNGFEDLLTGLYSSFHPDIEITPSEGKVFVPDSSDIVALQELEGVEALAMTLEEVAFFEYKGSQVFGKIKGVDNAFKEVTDLDSFIFEGKYDLNPNSPRNHAIIGYGLRRELGVSVNDMLSSLSVYMLKRKKSSSLDQPFKRRFLYPVGTFSIQQQFDDQYMIADLAFVRELRSYQNGEISAIEIKRSSSIPEAKTVAAIKKIMGDNFHIKNTYQQNEAFLKLMNVEKWIGFAIVSLTLVLVGFNMIGCLLMVVIEKKNDIAILKAMGATDTTIRSIFLTHGFLISLIGLITGIGLAILLYLVQVNFGIISMEGFIIDAYPISLRPMDFLWVTVTVLSLGVLFSLIPAWRASRIKVRVQN